MTNGFDLDNFGNLISQPVKRFAVSEAGTAVIVAIAYSESLSALADGLECQRVQLLLTAKKAMELADSIKQSAEIALGIAAPFTAQ